MKLGIMNQESLIQKIKQAKDPTKFADWQKYYAAQEQLDTELLKNQQGVIAIPGNPEICAGDKIDITNAK